MKKWLLLMPLCFTAVQPVYSASVKELEEQVQEMRRVHDAQSKSLATAMAQMQEVLSEYQSLNGRVDQSQFGNTQQEKILNDNQMRLNALEDRVSLLVQQLEELKTVGLLPSSTSKTFSEFQSFQKGLSKVNAEAYKDAIQTLQSFIDTNPKSRFVEYAQYWIGESLFAMRDYPAAIAEYQKVIKKYPSGAKVPSAMLKQGYAFYEMQSFEDSKVFLSKVASKYPQSNEAILAKGRIQQIDELLSQKEREAIERKAAQ